MIVGMDFGTTNSGMSVYERSYQIVPRLYTQTHPTSQGWRNFFREKLVCCDNQQNAKT